MKNVISLKDLERMQREGKSLSSLPEGAILTPSARDFLNDLESSGATNGAAVAASLLATTLIAGIIGTTWGLIEARYQAGVAETKRREAEASEKAERIAKVQAQVSLQKVTKGIEILGSIFKGLKPGQAEEYGKSLSTLLGERLDLVTQELDGEAVGNTEMARQ